MGRAESRQTARQAARSRILARQRLFEHRQAVRLTHRRPAGVTIDTYAGHLLLTDYAGLAEDTLRQIAQDHLDALADAGLPALSATAKRRPDNLSHTKADPAPIALLGNAPPPRFAVREFDWQHEVGFEAAGFATGLFLDAAEARLWVHQHAADRDVLNLFSYTGAFSIAAATGGAGRVIEVDTARKWLDWAKANQQLNDVTTVRQRRNDAVAFLQRHDPAGYDLLICDPPSYANPKKGKRFRIDHGYKLMAPHLTRVLRPGGHLLAMCNHAQTTAIQFRKWLPRELKFIRWIPIPPDFEGADHLKIACLTKG